MTAQPKAVPPIPEGTSTVMPWIISRDTAKLLDFMKQAFGAQELSRLSNKDGTIIHAEVRIGNSVVGAFDTREGWPETPCFLRLYVEDADAVYQQALAAGAVSVTEMTSLVWGERGGRAHDPVGNIWWMREPRRAGQSRGDRTARHRAAVSRCHPVYPGVAGSCDENTGLAERASELSPEVGLETHIQDIEGLLQEKDLHGVILVGHSYGAMVITGVVDRVPERIAHLVYLDTFVPHDGESMADISPLVIRLLRRQAQAHGDGYRIASRGTYGVTEEPDRSWVLSSVTPQPLKTFEQPLHLKNPAIVSTKRRTHIDCTSGFFFSLMRRLLGRRALPPTEAGWRLRRLPTGHDAMITMPRELADLLLEVV